MIIKDLGAVTAYAAAVEKGYTGTEEEFATLMASYATVAEEAAESAESASQSAESASASAQTATSKASEASTSATQAGASATSASQSASTATAKASEASASASTAGTKASEASASATTASTKASEASASATSAQTAQGLAESARDGAIDAKTDAETARDMAQQYAESIGPENIYSAYPTDTASGGVVSFADGADDIPMKSVVVNIEPVQDLHGYDHPWPAGGGKNKFHNTGVTTTSNGVTFTVNADGTVSCSGTASGTAVFHAFLSYSDLPQGKSLILNGCPAGGSFTSNYGTALCDVNGAALAPATDSGAGVTYTPANLADLAQYQIVVRSGINANGLVFKPMIRLASETDATFAPYSNICPISGWTGAQVARTGKNLLPVSNPSITNNGITFTVNDDGSITVNGTATAQANFFCVSSPIGGLENGKTYFLSGCPNGGGLDSYALWLNNGGTSQDNGSGVSIVYNNHEVVGRIRIASGAVCNNLVFRPQLELGSTATAYEPYQGTTYPITFPSEAGTVYGGTLDVTNGTLTVDRAIIASYNGDTLPAEWISDRDKYVAGTTPTTGAQVCYKLSQAVVYTLTPTEIKSLLGDNNLWADAGDTEVTYRADTAMYIDKKIAEVINALS